MNRSLFIAAALILAGTAGAQAADCKKEMNDVAAKCLQGSLEPIDIKRCNSQSQRAYEECEAINAVGAQKTLHPQPGNQRISRPGHIVPDLGDSRKLDRPENDD